MPPRPSRLVVITPTFHPEPIGTPLYATDLCRWFAQRGWSVRVITGQPFYPQFRRYRGYGRSTRHDALDSIEILRLPTIVPNRGRHTLRAISDLNFALQGMARNRQFRSADAVLSISPATPWVARVGRAIAEGASPHVCLVHDVQTGLAAGADGTAAAVRSMVRRSERWSLNAADEVLTLSSGMVETLVSIGVNQPINVLPLWATVEAPSNFPDLEREVQYSGNFGEKQGVHLLPQIASGLAARSIGLRVRGSGPRFAELLPELRRAARGSLQVEDLVPSSMLAKALGHSPIHIVLQNPNAGDFVMPSKVLNALTCGATVVAMADPDSAVAQLSQRVQGLIVVPPNRPDLLITAAAELMEKARLPEWRRTIAIAARQVFSRDAVLQRLEAILQPGDAAGTLISDQSSGLGTVGPNA